LREDSSRSKKGKKGKKKQKGLFVFFALLAFFASILTASEDDSKGHPRKLTVTVRSI